MTNFIINENKTKCIIVSIEYNNDFFLILKVHNITEEENIDNDRRIKIDLKILGVQNGE